MTADTTVSVCVPTKDRLQLLESCLVSILRQELPPGIRLIEICVLDNSVSASAHSVVSRLAESQTEFRLKYQHLPGGGYATVRNALLEMASHDIDFLGFVDDDEVVDSDWLAQLTKCATGKSLDIVGGPVEVFASIGELPQWFIRGGHRYHRPTATPRGLVPPTGNLLVNGHALRQSGLRFDSAFDRIGGEDTDWVEGLLALGLQSGYCPAARAREFWPPERLTRTYLRRRAFRAGRSYWVSIAKRDSIDAMFVRVASAACREGLSRVAIGLIQFAAAMITADSASRSRAVSTAMRGSGILFESSAHLRSMLPWVRDQTSG